MLMQEEVDGVVCGSRLGTVVIFSCALTLSFSAGRSLAGASTGRGRNSYQGCEGVWKVCGLLRNTIQSYFKGYKY